MIVQCPECSSRYLLAESLLGPEGARVRCPACRGRFDVAWPERDVACAPRAVTGTCAEGGDDPGLSAALAVLEAEVPRILAAQERGALFSEAGAALHGAFVAYRGASRQASATAFREALKRRWGIDLPGVA